MTLHKYSPMAEWERPFFSDRMPACPLRGDETRFQLVDEFGEGAPYAGLRYEATDMVGQVYSGLLDANGYAKVTNHFCGALVLKLDVSYGGAETLYNDLVNRPHYPLPITELQVRAEQTRFFHQDAARRKNNPAKATADEFYQVEVRDLVRHGAHLPPPVSAHHPLPQKLLGTLNKGLAEPLYGVTLLPNGLTVLEVRPLRALRPLLSTDSAFCALNLYQLALLASLSYTDFGQEPPNRPETTVKFPHDPSVGNLIGQRLAQAEEAWKVDAKQVKRYYPLYEDVPYSQRLEILPFDPALYPQNHPERGEEQEHPARLHFFDDTKGGTNTQAYISHHEEAILIAVRGTAEVLADGWRDADALQVPFEEGAGKAHRGFYEAYRALKDFVQEYLDRFYSGQKLIICGHSLGGAIALLLAEALRRSPIETYDIVLYTYGAPRAGDAEFVAGAQPLTHYRMVNYNDPVPSVPAPWMNGRRWLWGTGLLGLFVNPAVGALLTVVGVVRVGGQPYRHHGDLRHFTPVALGQEERSAILWTPGCDTLDEAGCSNALRKHGDHPERASFLGQLFSAGDHSMVNSYVPHCWATLRRWQQAQEAGRTLVTEREYDIVAEHLEQARQQLREERRRLYEDRHGQGQQKESAIAALSAEIERLEQARQRLATLRYRHPSLADLYGSLVRSPSLEAARTRWTNHMENRVQEQLAMIPASPLDDYRMSATRGVPDVDTLG
ncbi:lipase family protein [Pseudomonas citronellolis]|uniref:lipase family protein n=1 Tax=Pseudomonas citronellolis TaxID=53408 RepID=UPI003C2FAA6B